MGDRFISAKKRQSRSKGLKIKTNLDSTDEMGKSRSDQSPLGSRERKSKKERWLLTRKTWRYMADAGRRLIPEGVHNRPEDVPKIEAYFQEVCQREPKFLLWRKSSYPGALGLRSHNRRARTRKKGGSCKEKASSADEADELKTLVNPCGGGLFLTPTSSGRFDLHKLTEENKEAEDELLQQLQNLLEPKGETSKKLNHQELFDKLEKYLHDIQKQSMLKHRCDVSPDPPQRELLDTLRRHYSRSPNRESVISNLLTDRKLLEKLYFDLRRTRGFRGAGTAYLPEWRSGLRHRLDEESASPEESLSPEESKVSDKPPLIEIEEINRITKSIQTLKIHQDMLKTIEEKLKKPEEEPSKPQLGAPKTLRRRSSIDHDDISPSVGDTIKRYLKMARKKSIDTDKADRFKTINYDKNLRNIKPKGEITMPGDDDGLNKGSQTEDSWVNVLRELKIEESWVVKEDVKEVVTIVESKPSSSRSSCESLLSPTGSQSKGGILSSGQSFLSNLLHGLQHASDKSSVLPTAMQKSKSSTSVGRSLVSKKIWRGRSKSQSRIPTTQPCSWTPQGNCTWSNLTGRQVTLTDTTILQLSEVERRLLQKVALAKLQALNIGCNVQVPSETVGSSSESKPKRRPHLLKRKAITTSFFDTSRGKEKEGGSGGGLVFGIPLSQCVENERVCRNTSSNISFKNKDSTFPDDSDLELRRKSHHGSRTSFSSLIEPRTQEESAGSTESLGGSVPGLLDSLSVGSAADITLSTTAENEPSVPNIVSSCLRHIENFGLHTLGIFRVSSSKKRVRQLREDFDSGKEIALGEDCCPHDVATLLKEYFRDLPEPLLCRDLYQAFVHTQKIRNRRLQYEALQHLIQLLPVPNRDTLWSLLNFLSLVAANSEDHKSKLGEFVPGNKMDSNNLATLFAPNILHSMTSTSVSKESLSSQSCEERIDVINVIRSMIDHNKDLFQVSAELLDEVYVHMMDTHPEALDALLRKRDVMSEEAVDDLDSGALEEIGTGSESSSLPQSPKAFGEPLEVITDKEERRVYSREQFLHESAGFDDYDIDGRSRHREKERSRISSSKKRWRDSENRLPLDSVQHPDSRHSEDEDHKSPSLSVDSSGQSGIIKASLTIPTSTFALNLDDNDIPFIEDTANTVIEGSKHQMTIGMVRSKPTAGYSSSRHRSTSGSDSSQTSTPVGLQPITGSLSLIQGGTGYDSAVGSSATFSSPPRNTTTPSVCSSSDREYFSSPPSWASSPPLSPDSQTSVVDYLPDDLSISTIGRISIATRGLPEPIVHEKQSFGLSEESLKQTEEGIPVVKATLKSQKKIEKPKPKELSKVTFTEARKPSLESEKKPETTRSVTKDLYQRVHSLVGGASVQALTETIPKSASSSQLLKKTEPEPEMTEWSRKKTTSISNIGGAVMRSKTADIERMLKIKPEVKKTKSKSEQSKPVEKTVKPTTVEEEKKKYAKRRYTDTRHQTKTIVDVTEKPGTSTPKTQSVWKRREIISSPPNKGGEDS